MIRLEKYQSFGNDFLIGASAQMPSDLAALAIEVCDRRTGIGVDGLIAVDESDRDMLRMYLYNADGSRAELSGNGLGCVGYRYGKSVVVLTDVGPRDVEVDGNIVEVDMGMPSLGDAPEPYTGWGKAVAVDVGNPHVVVIGNPNDERWSQRLVDSAVNVEVVDPESGYTRVWERGVGETQSCGSGACAVAVALDRAEFNVQMPGGLLRVTRRDGRTWLATEPSFVAAVEFA